MVTGSRSWDDAAAIEEQLRKVPPGSIIVHGGAPGADTLAAEIADRLGLKTESHPIDRSQGRAATRAAGIARNQRMIDTQPDAVLAFHRDNSPGTQDAIERARQAGIPLRVVGYGQQGPTHAR
jgi:sugar (pentulose or hexulose) kinase